MRRALTDQAAFGAIAPTSATVAGRLASVIPPASGTRVLELGAGTGAISAAIAARLGPDSLPVAVERDPALPAAVEHVAPRARRVTGDAADLEGHLAELGTARVDVLVSSLPWSNFAPEYTQRVLAAACSVLTPDGVLATIAYRPTRLNPRSRRFHRLLDASFAEVMATSTTWANLPPARLLICRRPRHENPDA